MSGEMFLMYIGALFIAIVAIEIYKTDIDDGTELLLCSKPMTRIKQCFCKLMVFLTIVFTFSIFTILCSSLAYVTHVVNLSDFL
jgi:ABC-2 type transport system permease protein